MIDLSRIDEGYLCSDKVCYADTRNEAKKLLLHQTRYDGMTLKHEHETELNYINIPVIRCREADIFDFEGTGKTLQQINQELNRRERWEKLDAILVDENITYCYIMKHGSFYCSNWAGYTAFAYKAGIYDKKEAVIHAKGCDEITIRPIIKDEHNKMVRDLISELETKIIKD